MESKANRKRTLCGEVEAKITDENVGKKVDPGEGSASKLKDPKSQVEEQMKVRVFHKNTFLKEKVGHTLTTPYRAYINHTQKISFLGQV